MRSCCWGCPYNFFTFRWNFNARKKKEPAGWYGRDSTYKPFCTSVPIENEFNNNLIKICNSIKPNRRFMKNKIYRLKFIFLKYVFGNDPVFDHTWWQNFLRIILPLYLWFQIVTQTPCVSHVWFTQFATALIPSQFFDCFLAKNTSNRLVPKVTWFCGRGSAGLHIKWGAIASPAADDPVIVVTVMLDFDVLLCQLLVDLGPKILLLVALHHVHLSYLKIEPSH